MCAWMCSSLVSSGGRISRERKRATAKLLRLRQTVVGAQMCNPVLRSFPSSMLLSEAKVLSYASLGASPGCTPGCRARSNGDVILFDRTVGCPAGCSAALRATCPLITVWHLQIHLQTSSYYFFERFFSNVFEKFIQTFLQVSLVSETIM